MITLPTLLILGLLNDSFLETPRVCEKRGFKNRPPAGICSQEARGNPKGEVWQALRARKPKIKLRGPMARDEAVAVISGRPGLRARMLRYSGNEQAGCVCEGQGELEPEHSSSRSWEPRPGKGSQR